MVVFRQAIAAYFYERLNLKKQKTIYMSRFKLFGIMQAMMLAVVANPSLTTTEKQKEAKALNKESGGVLFSSGIMPSRTLNQRQKRKRWAQTNQRSKK
jgi:hypothetical protein